jgi:hypothetical protein
MLIDEDDYNDHLAHYGILRRSGRYPWGSGEDPPTHNRKLLDHIQALKNNGMTEAEIAKGMGMSTTELRAEKSIAIAQQKQSNILMAQRLKDKGYKNTAIGERMGVGESVIRSWLAPGAADKAKALTATADRLKAAVEEHGVVAVGEGVANRIKVAPTRLNAAVAQCKVEGYEVIHLKVPQLGTGKDTNLKVLAKPGTTWAQANKAKLEGNIHLLDAVSEDGGRTFGPVKKHEPVSIHPDRVDVRYGGEGGEKTDGMIYVRDGVEDVSLGSSHYAQVRIKVGDGHYLKGMAMYKDDMPDGIDIVFNTKKERTGSKFDAMKPLEDDPDLPFGSVTRPLLVNAGGPDEHVKSAMNIVNAEGKWGEWSKNLSSQMLSKQKPSLAKQQLDMSIERREREFEEIRSLTNPTIKKKLLESFADSTDSAAWQLKAAALPRQATQVILPIESMKPTEIYAPNFRHGERVVLIRFPHGGKFEIPELVVNNRQPEARKLLGKARDAVGIHHSVAQHLSGADFDGDTVLVIPNDRGLVSKSPALESLRNFDPMQYHNPDVPRMSKERKQPEMGMVSNLITDMTIRGASNEELARAVKHSMVVIDANKHHLDYKQSYIDHGIKQLKAEYQHQPSGGLGASTLISRRKSPTFLPERKPRPHPEGGPVDKTTGAKVFVETGRKKRDAKGNEVVVKRRFRKLEVTDDAHDLVSVANTPVERLYADHSNRLKAMANRARLEALNTPRLDYSPSANKAYSSEVESILAQLRLAKANAPLETQAQLLAGAVVRAKKDSNPNLDKEDLDKIKTQALTEARLRMGANKKLRRVVISDREWEAIQAGAISNQKLKEVLDNTDLDALKERATPRSRHTMTAAMKTRARQMVDNGFTRSEIADQLGVSTTTLDREIEGLQP